MGTGHHRLYHRGPSHPRLFVSSFLSSLLVNYSLLFPHFSLRPPRNAVLTNEVISCSLLLLHCNALHLQYCTSLLLLYYYYILYTTSNYTTILLLYYYILIYYCAVSCEKEERRSHEPHTVLQHYTVCTIHAYKHTQTHAYYTMMLQHTPPPLLHSSPPPSLPPSTIHSDHSHASIPK